MNDTRGSQSLPSATPERSKEKPKIFRCRFCPDVLHRLEHIQRHERTHTKEKPFSCSCGKAFARRDILLRHEKLVHDEGVERDDRSSRLSVAATLSSPVATQPSVGTDRPPEWTSHDPGFTSTSSYQSMSEAAHVTPMSQSGFFSGQGDPRNSKKNANFDLDTYEYSEKLIKKLEQTIVASFFCILQIFPVVSLAFIPNQTYRRRSLAIRREGGRQAGLTARQDMQRLTLKATQLLDFTIEFLPLAYQRTTRHHRFVSQRTDIPIE